MASLCYLEHRGHILGKVKADILNETCFHVCEGLQASKFACHSNIYNNYVIYQELYAWRL